MHHENALPEGHWIQGYEIISVLGAGGFGITYLAHDVGLDLRVAIKEYLPQDLAVRRDRTTVIPKSAKDQDHYRWGLERFFGEAQLLAKFKHPNIVRVMGSFEANGTAYMVMDYEPGQTLGEWLEGQQEPPDEAALKTLFLPVLDGIRAVHAADFLHRDIKPDNIYIREDGNPMLIDFGSARLELGGKSRSLSVIVSEGYAPKEQYTSRGKQGAWTDIYGIGASLYHSISGKTPVGAMDRAEARDNNEGDPLIPALDRGAGRYGESFLRAIDHALAFIPKDRPQTVREFQRELLAETPAPAPDPISESTPAPTPASASASAPAPAPDSRPWYKSYGAVIGGLLLAVLLSIWQPWSQDNSNQEAQARQQALEDRQAALDAEEAVLRQAKEKHWQAEETKRLAEQQRQAEEEAKDKADRAAYELAWNSASTEAYDAYLQTCAVNGCGYQQEVRRLRSVLAQALPIQPQMTQKQAQCNGRLNSSQLLKLVRNRTAFGRRIDVRKPYDWKEYQASNGSASFRKTGGSVAPGKWKVESNQICWCYGSCNEWKCKYVEARNNCASWYYIDSENGRETGRITGWVEGDLVN